MYITGIVGTLLFFSVFIVPGLLLIFPGIALLVLALALSGLEDSKLDRKAKAMAPTILRSVARCRRDENVLAFDPTQQRWFCPACRTWY